MIELSARVFYRRDRKEREGKIFAYCRLIEIRVIFRLLGTREYGSILTSNVELFCAK